jgi:hypothetical protein
MIEAIRSFKWARFKGEGQWIRCFAHILNLIAQVILRPFGSHQKGGQMAASLDQDLESDDDNHYYNDEGDPDDPDEQIQLYVKKILIPIVLFLFKTDISLILRFTRSESGDDEDDERKKKLGEGILATDLIGEDDDVKELSDEGEDDRYTSKSCKETLAKVRGCLQRSKCLKYCLLT